MKNEYGAKLDSNGYAPSIIQPEGWNKCYICGCTEALQRHEPFNGANREKSKNLGMWVLLCQKDHTLCHMYPKTYGQAMKRETQLKAMLEYGWTFDDWRVRFGKSWL